MKKLILFIAIITSTVNAQEGVFDPWKHGKDKQKHELIGHGFGVSGTSLMLNSRLGYGYYESAFATSIVSVLPFAAKEGYDHSFKRGGFFSEQDFVWSLGGAVEGSFMTASLFKVSDWMLDKKIYGVRDSYLVPAAMIGGGSAFLSELGKWMVVPGYRFNVVNFGIKTICYGVSMLTKRHIDKKKGKHKYFEEKFKL